MTADATDAKPSAERAVMAVRDLDFGYGRTKVLDRVNLEIHPRDFLAIIGPNGGGKTTLIKILLGLERPWSGEVTSRLSRRKGCLGYVPQYATFEEGFPLRVLDVVLMGRLGRRGMLRRYSAEDRKVSSDMLDRLGLADVRERLVSELSGGQLQRVLIARAMTSAPEILFLDEPTASIDVGSRETLRELLLELNATIPIVIITHDLSSLPQTVKNIACLNRELFYHSGAEVPEETLEKIYGCEVDLISHGHPHRVLPQHERTGHRHD